MAAIAAFSLLGWRPRRLPMSRDGADFGFPLIATTFARKQIGSAVKLAKGLFPDSQHPIDEEVLSETRRAIDSWENDGADSTESKMKEALETAERHHYI